MEIQANQLKGTLQEELELYKNILVLTLKKTDIITSGKIKELDKVTQMEQTLIMDIGKLEEKREKIVQKMKNNMGIHQDLDITELTKYLNNKDKEDIEKIRTKLLKILNTLKEKNKLNNMLIKDSLEYINFNLTLLTDATSEGTYSNNEKENKSKQSKNLFDAKV